MTRLPLLAAALLAATAISTAAFANDYDTGTSSTTKTTTTYHSENNSYSWNPFSPTATGMYVSGQAGGTFPTDDFDDSGVYNLSLGWQFTPMIRAEIEGGYRNNDIDSAIVSGDADVWTVMVNGLWDFRNDTPFTPYIGAGIGWAYQNLDSSAGDDNSNAFAYQGIAGVSYNFNANWALTAQYNYIDTTNFDYSAHEVKGGLRYTF